MASCPTCGQRLPKESRYCPQCGRPTGDGGTKVLELPPDETGQVPVAYMETERRYYGVTPTVLAVVLAAGGVVLALVLLSTGHWPIGLILLGLSLLLVLVTVETRAVRERASVAADSVATRGRATTRIFGLRRDLRKMAVLRGRLLFELGEAVYRGDEQATEAARQRVVALDDAWRQREAEMQSVIAETHNKLHRRRLEVQPTAMVELPEEPAAPGEQDPVGPAVIPEPYPPPDEGSPPEPAIIPEPGPLGPEERDS